MSHTEIFQGEITDQFRSLIAKTRYARWIEEYGRRETWAETVGRYADFISAKADLTPDEKAHLRYNVLNHRVMPSMRLMMTAGEAAERSPISAYNCSFIAVDDLRAFDETLYILMNGTGVGFSVEREHVDQLPALPAVIEPSEEVIVVHDSKEGWAQSYRELIASLWRGELPKWDLRQLRPAGARLRTFGGRSSGPEPLNELFEFTVKVAIEARGRRLTTLEVHEIMCKVGSIVVVGGVRRAALISLSSLDDELVRDSKSGGWYETKRHLALSNNSAVYHRKPTREVFDEEWAALVASGSGERGVFNLGGGKKNSPHRRNKKLLAGTNPCLTADTWVMTELGPRQIGDIVGTKARLGLHGNLYDSTGFFKTGTKPVFKLTLDNGMSVRATDNHQIMTESGWKELGDITVNDRVALSFNEGSEWGGAGTEHEGYLLGVLVGDGTFATSARIDVWESSASIMDNVIVAAHRAGIGGEFHLATQVGNEKKWSMQSRDLSVLAARFGVTPGSKTVTKQIEEASSEFYAGFLRGYFDADGSVQGNADKGFSIRLDSTSLSGLKGVQRMLSRLGSVSKVYEERRQAQHRWLPNADREPQLYYCKASHTLVISRDSMRIFADRVGFGEVNKAEKLSGVGTGIRGFYKDRKFSKVVSIIADGIEDVYDATVPEVSSFDANGIHVHNCAEILLRSAQFCNLSEVVVREDDSLDDLREKVSLASKMGTWQASLTNFPYLRDIWRENTEEEALLGVSLTGTEGHSILNGSKGREIQIEWLTELRKLAVTVNRREARRLGINPAAAVTAVKPSGTVSQLTGVASGLHAWHDDFYIRRVRMSSTDPVCSFLEDAGMESEVDFYNDRAKVFSFPFAAPAGAITRHNRTAIEQLENWLVFKEHWTEHNPSITVSVAEDEWEEVGDWVYEHFDKVTGISFLPKEDENHTYEQAPFETITKEQYEEMAAKMPNVDWSFLPVYEIEDTTTGMQELACVSGQCDVSDFIKEADKELV